MAYGSSAPSIPALPKTQPVTESKEQTRLAPRYRVLIHNDDVTPMHFVVMVLNAFFRKNFDQAMEVMMTAHKSGLALVGVYGLEEAEFRVEQAHSKARGVKYPLKFTIEPES